MLMQFHLPFQCKMCGCTRPLFFNIYFTIMAIKEIYCPKTVSKDIRYTSISSQCWTVLNFYLLEPFSIEAN